MRSRRSGAFDVVKRTLFAGVATAALCGGAIVSALEIDLGPQEDAGLKPYNFKCGNLQLALESHGTARWDSNVEQTEVDEKSSWVFIPGITLGVYWPVSPLLTIKSDIVAEYEYYTNSDIDSEFLVGGSNGLSGAFDIDMAVGNNSVVTFSNEFSRSLDALNVEARGNRSDTYSLSEYKGGLQYKTDLTEQLQLLAKYTFTYQWSSDDDYQYHDLYSHAGDLALMWRLNPDLQVGPYGRVEDVTFKEDIKNDATLYEGGLAYAYVPNARFKVTGNLGYATIDFDDSNEPLAGENFNGIVGEVKASLSTSERMGHSFSASYGPEFAITAPRTGFSKDLTLQYGLAYDLTKKVGLSGDVAYMKIRESDFQGENADLYRLGVGAVYRFTEKTRAGMQYRYTTKNSDERDRDFGQNRVDLTVSHSF